MSTYISEWLVLGPIYNAADQVAEHADGDGHPVAVAIIADIDKSNLDPLELTDFVTAGPVAGDTLLYTSGIFPGCGTKWQPVAFQAADSSDLAAIDDNIHRDLASAGFAYRHHSLAFFLVYVTAPEERKTQLLVRSDDRIRVWLNGEEISLAFPSERDISQQETGTDVLLKKGENALLCAVAETHSKWSFSARFADDTDLSMATTRWGVPATPPVGTVAIQLQKLSDSYTVFEPDQVLSEKQLNSVSDWFEDSERLGRLFLHGAGVAAGLRVSMGKNTIAVTKGFGLTTDGDLLHFDAEIFFDRFRAYDRTRPEYSRFKSLRNADGSYRIYELIPGGKKVETKTYPLDSFAATTKLQLGEMTVVFYMENYVTDPDFCSEISCNNEGRVCRNNPTILLVPRREASALLPASSPNRLLPSLPEVNIPRVALTAPIDAGVHVIDAIRKAADDLHGALTQAMSSVWSSCRDIFEEALPADPAEGWKSKLAGHRKMFDNSDYRIAWFLGLVRDVAETFNLLRELVLDDETWLGPPFTLFPKHLLLGNLDGSGGNLTPFYPSPLISRTADKVRHARFLVNRIGALVDNFQLPGKGAVRITPNRGHSLEERPIPFYYNVKGIFRSWNYQLHRRGLDMANYSYNAASYGGPGNPCATLTNHWPTFRVEGHLGYPVATALIEIRNKIAENNLPIAVRAVLAGDDLSKVLRPRRITDLHHMHKVLRTDLIAQMDDVIEYTGNIKDEIGSGIDGKIIRDANESDRLSIQVSSSGNADNIIVAAQTMKNKAARTYEEFDADTTWTETLQQTMEGAGKFKYDFGHVLKTEFNTPYDSLISSTHLQWLDWIGKLIRERNKQHDDRLRLSRFLERHPGIDHRGEVPAGGTFILVHDSAGTVIADFVLPYHVPLHDDDLDDIELAKPPIRPPFIIGKGTRVIPSLDNILGKFREIDVDDLIKKKLDDFSKEKLVEVIRNKLDDYKLAEIGDIREKIDDSIRYRVDEIVGNSIKEVKERDFRQWEDSVELSVTKLVNDLVSGKLAEFKAKDIAPVTEKVTSMEKDYVSQMRSALELVTTAVTGKQKVTSVPAAATASSTEAIKARAVREYATRKAIQEPTDAQLYLKQREEAEQQEAAAIIKTLDTLAAANVEVSDDAEAIRVMAEVSTSIAGLAGSAAGKTLLSHMGSLASVGSTTFKAAINTMTKQYGG